MLHKAKHRAKQLGRDFTIDIEDIIIPPLCPILGIPLFRGEGKVCNNSPTLDRIDTTKGYVKGNVAVISQRANQMKSDATLEELRAIITYIERINDE